MKPKINKLLESTKGEAARRLTENVKARIAASPVHSPHESFWNTGVASHDPSDSNETLRSPAHSPLPWTLAQTGRIYDERGGEVADLLTEDREKWTVESKANAALIVAAVNAHQQLVAALEELLRAHDGYPSIKSLPEMPHWKQARAALALVKP